MGYSRQEVEEAIYYALPSLLKQDDYENVPRLLEDAAIELFLNEDVNSQEAEVVRMALADLRTSGQLNYSAK